MSDVTHILNAVQCGDKQAADRLLLVVYEELRMLAQRNMAGERSDHTLGATALVHEAYLKLIGNQEIEWQNRAHFFASAAEAMRRILIDRARSRGRIKRGGDRKRIPLKGVDLAVEQDSSEILALDEALQRLQNQDGRMHEVVMLRFFAGLSVEETAEAMDISPRTAKRDWTCARAWLHRAMSETRAAQDSESE